MDYRNPAFNRFGTIDCEIEHPKWGWIPFTCDPSDTGAEFNTAALFAEMQPHAAPYVEPPPPPPPSPAELIDTYRRAVQAHIDATAQARGYDSGVSAASYAGDPNPAWAAEAAAFIAWRSAVWVVVFDTLAEVQAGLTPMPETPTALIATLPQLDWNNQNE
jgi:hypothetical protein